MYLITVIWWRNLGVQMKISWGIIETCYYFELKNGGTFWRTWEIMLSLNSDVDGVKPYMNWSLTIMVIEENKHNINSKFYLEMYAWCLCKILHRSCVVLHYFITLTIFAFYSYIIHKWMTMEKSRLVMTFWSWYHYHNLCYIFYICRKPTNLGDLMKPNIF